MKKSSFTTLPPLWRERWQNVDPFWHVFHLQGKVYREQPGRKTLRFLEEGEPYFVKCHFGVGWREIFKNLLLGRLPITGAKNEYRAIQRLQKFGFVPEVVGYGWRGKNPATIQSFIITKELSFTVSLEDFCRDWPKNPPAPALKWALIRKIADIARTMHASGINHRDFYLCHFLLDITGGCELLNPQELNVYLIDLHRAQARKRVPKRWRVKDIAGLYFSAMNIGLTKRDCWRFCKAYEENASKSFWSAVNERALKLYRKEWKKLPLSLQTPFYLPLLKQRHTSFLEAKKILRCLPKKRLTVLGTWQQQEVVAKIFVNRRHLQREVAGHQALVKRGFATPGLLQQSEAMHQALFVLLFHYQKNASAFATVFYSSSSSEKTFWLKRLLALIHQQHEHGLWQEDLHFNNFLIIEKSILTIDVGTVRNQIKPLSLRQREKNLSLLFAQLPSQFDSVWKELATPALQQQTYVTRQNLERKFLAKVQRSCSAYSCENHKNYSLLLHRDFDTSNMRQWIQELLHLPAQNKTVLNSTFEQQPFILQFFKPQSLRDLFHSPARRQWLFWQRQFFAQHINHMPIALIEKNYRGIKTWSCIILPYTH